MKNLIPQITKTLVITCVLLLTACGGGKLKSEKSKLLIKKQWNLDVKANNKLVAEKAEKTTGITNLAQLELKGDVGDIANAMSKTILVFGQDQKDKSKLSYSFTYGTGLTTSSSGFWEWNADETKIIMKGWDYNANKEKPSVAHTVKELTASKLILVNDESGREEIYNF